MRITPTLAVAAFLLLAGQGLAQERPSRAHGDQAAVVVAALDWFAGSDHARQFETFVVAGKTDGWEARAPGAGGVATDPERPPVDLNLPQAAIARLAARAGARRVERCDTIDKETNSLCGVPVPWIWVMYDLPWVSGDRAIVNLDIRWLSWDGPRVGKGHREAYRRYVTLTREQGTWVVTSARP
jgi:hypothetical protein